MTLPRTATAPVTEPDLHWYIVRCYSGAEWQVRKALLRRGIEAFLPSYIAEIRRNRFEQGEIRPLFKGYLFAGLELGQEIKEIRSTPNALGVLTVAEKPVEIPEQQLHRLRLQSAEAHMVAWGTKARVLRVKVGDWVAVPDGLPGAGTPVEIEAIDRRGKIKASVGSFRVEFPKAALTEECRRPSKVIPQHHPSR